MQKYKMHMPRNIDYFQKLSKLKTIEIIQSRRI